MQTQDTTLWQRNRQLRYNKEKFNFSPQMSPLLDYNRWKLFQGLLMLYNPNLCVSYACNKDKKKFQFWYLESMKICAHITIKESHNCHCGLKSSAAL